LEIMGTEECYDHLRRSPVGRVGFVDAGEAVILPVNFAVDGRSLVFRTGSGSKLAAAIMRTTACLEIDSWDDMAHTGWSVLAKGMAETVDDEETVARFEMLPVRPWTAPELRQRWVRNHVEENSGRRIVHPDT
jgi:nitroimidazol reductase NimA-like FMN-containing flavoprotein (pyridoxamine 5'-phosphate oxidase superfamily)